MCEFKLYVPYTIGAFQFIAFSSYRLSTCGNSLPSLGALAAVDVILTRGAHGSLRNEQREEENQENKEQTGQALSCPILHLVFFCWCFSPGVHHLDEFSSMEEGNKNK